MHRYRLEPGDQVEVFALDSIPQRLLGHTVKVVQVHRTMATIHYAGYDYRVPLRVLRLPVSAPDAARPADLRPCTCGGVDYLSCLCGLSPREWIEHAKTHPRVDPHVVLPKGWT